MIRLVPQLPVAYARSKAQCQRGHQVTEELAALRRRRRRRARGIHRPGRRVGDHWKRQDGFHLEHVEDQFQAGPSITRPGGIGRGLAVVTIAARTHRRQLAPWDLESKDLDAELAHGLRLAFKNGGVPRSGPPAVRLNQVWVAPPLVGGIVGEALEAGVLRTLLRERSEQRR